MSQTLDVEKTESKESNPKPKVCHIPDTNPFREPWFGTRSYCGVKPFVEGVTVQHTWAECLANHTLCVVCIAEYERIHGRLPSPMVSQ